jgi:hypothetical protein
LREDARALDASYQALIATAQPLGRHLDTRRLVRIASASRDALDARQIAIRDVTLIDGAMARLAEAIGLRITDYDTMAIE